MNKVSEIELTDKSLEERWSNVKEDFWGDLKSQTVIALKRLLETSMEIEIQDLVGAKRWKHIVPRPSFRNGHYFRNLLTTMGLITLLKVPRLREGKKGFKVLPRYVQRAPDVDKGVLEMFLAGVSTRRVQEVLMPWMGKPTLSAGTVSTITKVLDEEVQKFHGRKLSDEYLYLVLDGIYLKTKSPIHSKRRCFLVAYGIKEDGTRELIDFKLTRKGESQVAWESFLVSLKNRGLEGTHLKLVVVDGNKGLWNAIDLVWLNVPRQRCWAHKLRNVANKIPPFFQCPKELWIKLRTTNVIERVFREARRRTRPISCFQNRESVERIIFAIFHRQNNLWEEKPLWKQKYCSHI